MMDDDIWRDTDRIAGDLEQSFWEHLWDFMGWPRHIGGEKYDREYGDEETGDPAMTIVRESDGKRFVIADIDVWVEEARPAEETPSAAEIPGQISITDVELPP